MLYIIQYIYTNVILSQSQQTLPLLTRMKIFQTLMLMYIYLLFAQYLLFSFLFIPLDFKQFSHVNLERNK